MKTRRTAGESGGLRDHRQESRDGRGRAFVNVRRPEMIGNQRDFKPEAREDHEERGRRGRGGERKRQRAADVQRSRQAIQIRDAKKRNARCDGSIDKVFHGGFGGARVIARVARKHVGTQAKAFRGPGRTSANRASGRGSSWRGRSRSGSRNTRRPHSAKAGAKASEARMITIVPARKNKLKKSAQAIENQHFAEGEVRAFQKPELLGGRKGMQCCIPQARWRR